MRTLLATALLVVGGLLIWCSTMQPTSAPPRTAANSSTVDHQHPAGAAADLGDAPERHQADSHAEVPQSAPDGRRLRVVGPDGRAIGGAPVWWADDRVQGRIRDDEAAMPTKRGASSVADRLRVFGTVAQTDTAGFVSIPVAGDRLVVYASHEQLGAARLYELDAASALPDLVLLPGDTLVVDVFDQHGSPIADLPIAATPQLAPNDARAPTAFDELGVTDTDGRLVYRGWRQFAERRGSAHGPYWIGPLVAGAHAATFAAIPGTALEPVRIVLPRPIGLECCVEAADGSAVPWSDLVVRLWRETDALRPPGTVTREGRARHLVLPGLDYSFEVTCGRGDYGEGRLPTVTGDMVNLRCGDIVRLRGAVADTRTGQTLRIAYTSAWRPPQVVDINLGVDSGFSLLIGRAEVRGPLVLSSEERSCRVDLPPLASAVVDLGVLRWQSMFAHVRLKGAVTGIDPSLIALRGTAPAEPSIVTHAVRSATGDYSLYAPESVGQLDVACSAPGFARADVRIRRGEHAEVELLPLRAASVALDVDAWVDVEPLWLRLLDRFDEASSRWALEEHWTRLQRNEGAAQARFDAVPAGRYRAEVWSVQPCAVLASMELRIGGETSDRIDMRELRSFELRLAGPQGVRSCWVLAESQLDGRRPLPSREVPLGVLQCTTAAAERRVWVFGAGLLPTRVTVDAPVQTVVLQADTGRRLRGIDVDRAVNEPLHPAFGAGRGVHVYSIFDGKLRRQSRTLDALLRASSVRLPCDYRITLGDEQAIARFVHDHWVLDR